MYMYMCDQRTFVNQNFLMSVFSHHWYCILTVAVFPLKGVPGCSPLLVFFDVVIGIRMSNLL